MSQLFFWIDEDIAQAVVYNLKKFWENMTQPFLKILKGTFY